MNEFSKIRVSIGTATIAAGFFAGLVLHSGDLFAQEPKSENFAQAPDSWIGKQVITKYSAGLRGENQKAVSNRIFRVYTVQEQKGNQFRLASDNVKG
jgi:hypothetical protein